MILSQDQLALLNDISDDWYGLWEIDWFFNGAHPGWPFEARNAFLSALVSEELIKIFYGRISKGCERLEIASAMNIIQNKVSWAPREDTDDPSFYATTSNTGLEALKKAAGQSEG